MRYCVLEISTQTSSFRNPDFQNFHKTLILPPPSTIIGLVGSALGLSPKESQDFFDKSNVKLGIYGKSQGMAKDLWKYFDLNREYKKIDKKYIRELGDDEFINKEGMTSVIKREFLYKSSYFIAFISEDSEVIKQIGSGFLNPIYALTLGNSDSLAFIKKVFISENIYNIEEFDEVEYAILDGNIIDEVMDNIGNGRKISIYNTSYPLTYDLPIKFDYKSNYGMRNIIKRKQFSFVSKKMKLNIMKKGIFYKDVFIPIFDIL